MFSAVELVYLLLIYYGSMEYPFVRCPKKSNSFFEWSSIGLKIWLFIYFSKIQLYNYEENYGNQCCYIVWHCCNEHSPKMLMYLDLSYGNVGKW